MLRDYEILNCYINRLCVQLITYLGWIEWISFRYFYLKKKFTTFVWRVWGASDFSSQLCPAVFY